MQHVPPNESGADGEGTRLLERDHLLVEQIGAGAGVLETFDLEDSLRLDDPEGIEHVIVTYGPQAREMFRAHAH